jgi:hypothetical protein
MGSSVAITEAAVDLATAQKSLIARPGGHARVKELKLRPANAHCGHARARRPRPSGYQSSGGYCVPGPNTKCRAFPKVGTTLCPVGYTSSGDYCVETGCQSR